MKLITRSAKKIFTVAAAMLVLGACSKDEGTAPTNNTGGGGNNTPKPSWVDTIARKWTVVAATHKGSPDNSSQGLELDIKKGGGYVLRSTGYNGTWRFTDSAYKTILLDEGDPTFKTIWTITKLTAKRLEVDFKSPFTGGAAHWDLEPK